MVPLQDGKVIKLRLKGISAKEYRGYAYFVDEDGQAQVRLSSGRWNTYPFEAMAKADIDAWSGSTTKNRDSISLLGWSVQLPWRRQGIGRQHATEVRMTTRKQPDWRDKMANRTPSLTALLGLLAIAGYQNRDKIAEMLKGVGATENKIGRAHV